jgi:[acyl-carrier-protein] S-malonyltransferase
MRQIFDRADRFLGFSLSRLCFEGPIEELNQDLNAQLAIYTLSCGLTEILKKQNIRPGAVAGYSSGFYAAAYAAGCFDFSYGLEIVWRAGKILLDEGRKINGSMAVIFGLPFKQVARICQQLKNAQVAIINTPRQIIISGLHASIKKAMELSLNAGALDAYILPVATAYHSGFMKQSRERFLNEIKNQYLKSPLVPLMSYFTLDYVNGQKELKEIMASQLSNPVLWVDLIRKLGHNNNRLLIEVGPGAVLFRTVRWIDRKFEIVITATEEGLKKAINRHNLKSE